MFVEPAEELLLVIRQQRVECIDDENGIAVCGERQCVSGATEQQRTTGLTGDQMQNVGALDRSEMTGDQDACRAVAKKVTHVRQEFVRNGAQCHPRNALQERVLPTIAGGYTQRKGMFLDWLDFVPERARNLMALA